jgi:hypothetical protein
MIFASLMTLSVASGKPRKDFTLLMMFHHSVFWLWSLKLLEVDALSRRVCLATLFSRSVSRFMSVNFLWKATALGSHKREPLLNLLLRRFGDRRFVRCNSNVKVAQLCSDTTRLTPNII